MDNTRSFAVSMNRPAAAKGLAGLRREALAAPEDVGGEDGERDHEDDPDTVRAGEDGEIHSSIDDAEAGIQEVDEQSPPLDEQKSHADQDVQSGRLGFGKNAPGARQGRPHDLQPIVGPRLDDVEVGEGGEQEEKADSLQIETPARGEWQDGKERARADRRIGVMDLPAPPEDGGERKAV